MSPVPCMTADAVLEARFKAGFQAKSAAGFLLAAECVLAEKLDRYPAELDEAISALQALIEEAHKRLRQVEAFFDGP